MNNCKICQRRTWDESIFCYDCRQDIDIMNKVYIDVDKVWSGVLWLEISKEPKTIHEIRFCQFLNSSSQYYYSDIHKVFANDILNSCDKEQYKNDMIVTWRGREYDLPEICKILYPDRLESYSNILQNIMKTRDRDLKDICIKRGIEIKGGDKQLGSIWKSGLWATVDRLVYNGYSFPNRELDKKYKWARHFNENAFYEAPTSLKIGNTKEFTDNHRFKWKNEADVRALPLLEEALELLFERRVEDDKYRSG